MRLFRDLSHANQKIGHWCERSNPPSPASESFEPPAAKARFEICVSAALWMTALATLAATQQLACRICEAMLRQQ